MCAVEIQSRPLTLRKGAAQKCQAKQRPPSYHRDQPIVCLCCQTRTIGKSERNVLAIRRCNCEQWPGCVSDLLRHPERRNLLDGYIVKVDRVIIELTPIGNGAFQCRYALLNC